MTTYLSIRAAREGFRRAGRAWGRTAAVVRRDGFTDEQVAQLEADPNIDVVPCGPEGFAGVPAPAGLEVRAATVSELRAELLQAGIAALVPGQDDHWTAAGLPEVAALRTITGLASISADERTAAWEAAQAAAGPPDAQAAG